MMIMAEFESLLAISMAIINGGKMSYGIATFDYYGNFEILLNENELSIVHYTFFYRKGEGTPRDMKYLSSRISKYPRYLVKKGHNTDDAATWVWQGKSNGFEVIPEESVIMRRSWYAMSAVAESTSNPLIKPWTMPGATCIYDSSSHRFICRAENAHIKGLLITVGGN